MFQNTRNLIAGVLKLPLNETSLALTGYNYLGIWIFFRSFYPKVKCENIVIAQNGDIFVVTVFYVGG